MEYQALYRKFRPNTFSGVVGQEHITTVLQNQVVTGHTSHAYLFSGSRGTGKTSTAKILARAVNCLSPVNGEPCNECEACKVAPETNVDVIEMDAASNNGVDDMRALIEKAVFTPVKMKKKVYIIDEAHMLSAAAFNALLKTLEEPPSHVMFILATTEPHKIIPTITSRCQRFDFRRLRSSDIIGCLEDVLKKADATIEHEGLVTIARKVNGGMRDALSLADQCLSFCGNHVSAQDVNHILGSADFDEVHTLVNHLLTNNAASALLLLDSLISSRDITVLMQDITSHFRALLLAKVCGSCSDILDCSAEDMRKLEEQAATTTQERLMRGLEILSAAERDLKYYPQPRLLMETAFVKICRPEYESDFTAALDRLDILEKQMKENAGKQVVIQQVAEKPKPSRPQPKKRVVAEDAYKVYKELCDALPRMIENSGTYVYSIFAGAVFVEIVEKELRTHFIASVIYGNVMDRLDSINQVLSSIGYDLIVRPVLDEASEDEGMEETLLSQFGDIQIFD